MLADLRLGVEPDAADFGRSAPPLWQTEALLPPRPAAPLPQGGAALPDPIAPRTHLRHHTSNSWVTCGTGEKATPMHTLDALDAASLRADIPDFRPGDTLKVHVKVVEGNRSRIQVFQGVVIRRQGGGVRETFTVRKVSFGVGVERTFPRAHPDHRQDRGRDPR